MTFKLSINMDGDAFHCNTPDCKSCHGLEVKRIIREFAMTRPLYDLRTGDNGNLKDANGNTVGKWEVTE